jgi:hypothetical protein
MKDKARQPERQRSYCAMGQKFGQIVQHRFGPDLFGLWNIVQFSVYGAPVFASSARRIHRLDYR